MAASYAIGWLLDKRSRTYGRNFGDYKDGLGIASVDGMLYIRYGEANNHGYKSVQVLFSTLCLQRQCSRIAVDGGRLLNYSDRPQVNSWVDRS